MNWITDSVLLASTAFLAIAATPGPANVHIATTSMQHGQMFGLMSVLGVLCGSLWWGLLTACGISIAHDVVDSWTTALKVAGGFYLIWLAVNSVRSALSKTQPGSTDENGSRMLHRSFRRGLFIQSSNPNVVLTWIATILIATSPNNTAPSTAFLVVSICWMGSIFIYCAHAILFAHPNAASFYEDSRSKIEMAAALLFGFSGLMLLDVFG